MRTVGKGAKVISQKEANLLREAASGGSACKIMEKAGYRPMTSESSAESFIRAVKKKYEDANGLLIAEMEQIGVTMGTVAERIKEGLEATTSKKSGKKVVEVPDFATRHKYLETVMSVHGSKKPERSIVENLSSHENTVSLAEMVQENPELLVELKRRIEERTKIIDVTPPDADDGAAEG